MNSDPSSRSLSRVRRLSALTVAAGLLTACTDGHASDSHETLRSTPVQVLTVTTRPLSPRIGATGTVGGKEEVSLSFKVGGVISRILVDEGATIREGQLLAELAPVEITSEVAKAREGREKALRDLTRVRALQADSVATLEQLQDATTALQVAEQNVKIAEFNLRYASIRAPANGVVLRRQAEPGQLAAPGSTVLTVRSAARGMVLRAGLADRDVLRVRVGDEAQITFDAFPGKTFAGRVSQVAPSSSAATGTYEVEIALGGDGAKLASGLVGHAIIAAHAEGEYPMIPLDALLEADGDSATIFVIAPSGNKAVRRRIVVAQIDGAHAAVASGLTSGERVIVRGAAFVDESTPIVIVADSSKERR